MSSTSNEILLTSLILLILFVPGFDSFLSQRRLVPWVSTWLQRIELLSLMLRGTLLMMSNPYSEFIDLDKQNQCMFIDS